jgi:hypothetical protein
MFKILIWIFVKKIFKMQRLEVSGAVRHIYIYIYMCVCVYVYVRVCVCVCVVRRLKVESSTVITLYEIHMVYIIERIL